MLYRHRNYCGGDKIIKTFISSQQKVAADTQINELPFRLKSFQITIAAVYGNV